MLCYPILTFNGLYCMLFVGLRGASMMPVICQEGSVEVIWVVLSGDTFAGLSGNFYGFRCHYLERVQRKSLGLSWWWYVVDLQGLVEVIMGFSRCCCYVEKVQWKSVRFFVMLVIVKRSGESYWGFKGHFLHFNDSYWSKENLVIVFFMILASSLQSLVEPIHILQVLAVVSQNLMEVTAVLSEKSDILHR